MDDFDEAVKLQIEEKLVEEEVTASEEDFDTLGSYLLGTAAREKTFTADEIGFRIFRKYTRQEVPGIGPVIDKEQVRREI